MSAPGLEQIYREYFDKIYSFVAWRVGDKHQTEDIVSEIFIKVYENLSKVRSENSQSLGCWIYTIARNSINSFFRQNGRQRQGGGDFPDIISEQDSPEDVAEKQIVFARIVQLLKCLPPKQAEAITLKYLAGLSNQEIGLVTNNSVDNISSLISKGLRNLLELYNR